MFGNQTVIECLKSLLVCIADTILDADTITINIQINFNQTSRESCLVKFLFDSIAYIDFAESEEIEDDVLETVRRNVTILIDDFERHLSNACVGERLREGVHLAIVGEPNVGKSSLLNFLVQRPAAIVSATAGTTR